MRRSSGSGATTKRFDRASERRDIEVRCDSKNKAVAEHMLDAGCGRCAPKWRDLRRRDRTASAQILLRRELDECWPSVATPVTRPDFVSPELALPLVERRMAHTAASGERVRAQAAAPPLLQDLHSSCVIGSSMHATHRRLLPPT